MLGIVGSAGVSNRQAHLEVNPCGPWLGFVRRSPGLTLSNGDRGRRPFAFDCWLLRQEVTVDPIALGEGK